MSTGFWVADSDLDIVRAEKVRYSIVTDDGGRALVPHVGTLAPPEHIEAGSLVRLSLARWWRPKDSAMELRCYLQISGWFGTQ